MVWTVLAVLVTLLYPLALWLGQSWAEPRSLALLLVVAAALRLPAVKLSAGARWSVAGALLLVACAMWSNAMLPLKLYPVMVNAGFLAAFAWSLSTPVSMVERFARLREPELPAEGVAYTRRVTQAWCVFFAANGAIAAGTALLASDRAWWLYNGVIAYVLMGLMFGGELLVRRRVQAGIARNA
ncbi:MAG TPA: hypothetical protein VGE60_03945 [Telluria sp.]